MKTLSNRSRQKAAGSPAQAARTPPPRKSTKPASRRPSQAERRGATRTRILEATLHCLAQHGYAGTGVAQVVKKARVSRGAWSHHFASMDTLIVEAAQYLMGKVYERLGAVLSDLSQRKHNGDGMRGVIHTAWREFYASEVNTIYLELLIASRRSPKLAEKLGGLARSLEKNLGAASSLNFVAVPGAALKVGDAMHLNRWLLRGIALDAPLLPDGAVEQALDAWAGLLASQMRPR